MANEQFRPPNRSTHDPNSIFDPAGNLRSRNASYPDPNSWLRGDVNINTAPAGSAMEEYYRRMIEGMPTRRQTAYGDMGDVLGSFAGDRRDNRVIQGNAYQEYDRQMLEREAARNRLGLDSQSEYDRLKLLAGQDRRTAEGDAMQKIQLASYLQQGGLGGGSLPHLGQVSDTEKQAAGMLSGQMMDRLNSPAFEPTKFNPTYDYQPTDPSKYANPGKLERLGSYGGAVMGGLGALDMLTGGRSGDYISKLMGRIPGLGGAAAGAGGGGSAAGGLLPSFGPSSGVLRAGSGMSPAGAGGLMGNLMNYAPYAAAVPLAMGTGGKWGSAASGAALGAKVGSVVPGIGTAIGAGIGAGAGFLRGWAKDSGPSKEERAGREVASQARQQINAGATPEQIAQAQASGWENPQQALTHIMLSQRFGEAQASQMERMLFEAEKKGPQAVQQILAQLSQQRA